jgi:L-histidine N-alpha-methyltransferase
MQRAVVREERNLGARLRIETRSRENATLGLARDVRRGLSQDAKRLPPKYFYDELGSRLFDAICDTPEYYLTRSEHTLLREIADQLVSDPAPSDLIELGSGAARKTRLLLDALGRAKLCCRYVPFDVSEEMLTWSAHALLEEYPWLRVLGVVGDYERDLDPLPHGERRMVAFLGSTIGNFERPAAVSFLKRIGRLLRRGETLVLGTDLVKDPRVLNAAYNDARGLTRDFNKNVLRVINRELKGNFVLDRFRHVAFFDEQASQIEMHLESTVTHTVSIESLELEVRFAAGERILTEISRKFTRDSVEALCAESGLALGGWFVSRDGHFALSRAHPAE